MLVWGALSWGVVLADGLETFDNETAPAASYADGSFTGSAAIVWSYIQSRDASASGAINGAGLMLRNLASASKLYSSAIGGGIHDFSVSLKKAFTSGDNRQVELFINGVSKGSSVAFTDTNLHVFAVNNIDEPGDIVIEIRCIGSGQIVLDDLTWTSLSGGDNPNIQFTSPVNFGELSPGATSTQFLPVINTGTSVTLSVTALSPQSGDTNRFSSPTVFPLNILPNGATGIIQLVYSPGAVTGANQSATFNVINNDLGDGAKPLILNGSTTPATLTVSNVQYVAGATSNSPYAGQTIPIQGICTYVDSRGYVLSDASGGPWSGVYIDDINHGPDVGDVIRITGQVGESQNLTVISNISEYILVSASNIPPAPINVTATLAKQEKYECVTICISNATVSDDFVSSTTWQITDGTTCDVMHDNNRRLYRYIPRIGNTLTALCGIVWQNASAYRIQVRDDDDFVGRPVVHYALQGTVMTPDGPRTNWYVTIRDDDIVSVGASAPTVTVYNTSGLIFPGLLDTHNHQGWNSFPSLQFNNAPFGHRDEWGSDAEYSDWTGRRTTVRNHANVLDTTKYTIGKYGEILELMSGCIAIQGMAYNIEFAHPDVGIMNLEEFPTRIETDIFPWLMTASERSNMLKRVSGGGIHALLIHLSEGTDTVARAQFDTWFNWGMLTKETTIIHGVPYRTNEVDKIAAAGASIVWSPKSNMKLYHGTANIPLYKSRGVNIALAPDWTASGSYNLMEEMGYAWHINQSQFTNALTARDIVDMTTINAAKACGLDHRYGNVAAGYNAGIVVIENPGGDPYLALINARPKSVILTIVDGTPRFGNATLMTTMGFTGETINAWGTVKTLNLVRSHPFLTYETESFAAITSNLSIAHNTLTTTGELDSEELQFLSLNLLQSGPDNIVPFIADAPLSSPINGRVFTNDNPVTITFRSQDFWDNDSDHFKLVHRQIALVAASQPTNVLQVIATELTNTIANQNINFTLNYRGLHTNYLFRFLTADLSGSVRTSLITSVAFTIKPAAYDQDNDDLMDAWEQQVVNFNGGDGIASIYDVLPGSDFDGDGQNEEQEQFTGTLPANSNSYFMVDTADVPAVPGQIILQWPSATNRTYTLFGITNLVSGNRAVITAGIPATPPLNTYTSTVPASAYFHYLIRAQ
jgi:5-methylthioadenosine/S-adenosylhomocysteine deaminase